MVIFLCMVYNIYLYFQVEKLNTLGYNVVLFLGRKMRKPNTWSTKVLHPKWQLSDQGVKILDRMKALYELFIHGKCVTLFKILLHSQEMWHRDNKVQLIIAIINQSKKIINDFDN